MALDWLLACLHHLAVFGLAGVLAAEIALTAGALDSRGVLRLARVDAWYGVLAALALAAGGLRLAFGAKGYQYYFENWAFWTKMALFFAVGALSALPTFRYFLWRRRAREASDFHPDHRDVRAVRRILWTEAGLFALIPIAAAAMARGYGM